MISSLFNRSVILLFFAFTASVNAHQSIKSGDWWVQHQVLDNQSICWLQGVPDKITGSFKALNLHLLWTIHRHGELTDYVSLRALGTGFGDTKVNLSIGDKKYALINHSESVFFNTREEDTELYNALLQNETPIKFLSKAGTVSFDVGGFAKARSIALAYCID